MKFTRFVLCAIFFCPALQAATYYVSSAGNDSNAGTSTGAPWLTISKVNSVGLVPSDSVFFNGGDTFTGNLLVNPGSQPGPTTRITVSSYGTGKATINCANSYAVKIKDCGYVTVNNLISVGSGIVVTGTYPNKTGTTTSTTAGFRVEISTTSTWYGGIILDSLEASGSLFGIALESTDATATAALENFRITNCNVHDCGPVGIYSHGTSTVPGSFHQHSGILYRYGYIADCQSTNNPGVTNYDFGNPTYTYWSGFGIFTMNLSYSVVERCFTTECGIASYHGGGGPVGIIFVECANSVIRDCEASRIYAVAAADGNGIDLDLANTDCIIEYCYVHDCDGAGIHIFQPTTGQTIRYNIVENCARNNQACVKDAGSSTSLWYNNTFYHEKATSGPSSVVDAVYGSTWYNNIFSVSNGGNFGGLGSSAVLKGNTYNAGSGSSFSIVVNSVTYTSLSGLQAAGFEKAGSRLLGASGNPNFAAPGTNVTCLPTNQVNRLSSYDIDVGSVARGAGYDLLESSMFPKNTDWHGNAAIAGETDTLNGIDSGAVRYRSFASMQSIIFGGLTH